jgi:hypothetical protein
VLEINKEVWFLWMTCQTQWNAGLGLVGLNYVGVEWLANKYEIELHRCNLKKLQALERYEIERHNKK